MIVEEGEQSFAPSKFTLFHLLVTGIVIFFTTVNLRGARLSVWC